MSRTYHDGGAKERRGRRGVGSWVCRAAAVEPKAEPARCRYSRGEPWPEDCLVILPALLDQQIMQWDNSQEKRHQILLPREENFTHLLPQSLHVSCGQDHIGGHVRFDGSGRRLGPLRATSRTSSKSMYPYEKAALQLLIWNAIAGDACWRDSRYGAATHQKGASSRLRPATPARGAVPRSSDCIRWRPDRHQERTQLTTSVIIKTWTWCQKMCLI